MQGKKECYPERPTDCWHFANGTETTSKNQVVQSLHVQVALAWGLCEDDSLVWDFGFLFDSTCAYPQLPYSLSSLTFEVDIGRA